MKVWVQKLHAAVKLYVVLLPAFESFCYGNKSVFCRFSMMTVIVSNKCLSDEYWGVKNKTLPSRLEPSYFSPGCSGRGEVCGTGTVTHVRLGSFVHQACVSSAVPFGLACWEAGWGLSFGTNWEKNHQIGIEIWKLVSVLKAFGSCSFVTCLLPSFVLCWWCFLHGICSEETRKHIYHYEHRGVHSHLLRKICS